MIFKLVQKEFQKKEHRATHIAMPIVIFGYGIAIFLLYKKTEQFPVWVQHYLFERLRGDSADVILALLFILHSAIVLLLLIGSTVDLLLYFHPSRIKWKKAAMAAWLGDGVFTLLYGLIWWQGKIAIVVGLFILMFGVLGYFNRGVDVVVDRVFQTNTEEGTKDRLGFKEK
jgi:hypothetical protein